MKVTIEDLQDTFRIGYNAYTESRVEAAEIIDFFHNRQYTSEQKAILENRGQPQETFNVIKMMSRHLIGYYSTMINKIVVKPTNYGDIDIATLLNDTVAHTIEKNSFESEGNSVKLDGILSGLFCSYIDVVDTGKTDEFGRAIKDITIEAVNSAEIVLDPMSSKPDYSDARYIHRFKWLSEEDIRAAFGKYKTDKLTAYWNFLDVEEAEFDYKYGDQFEGIYRRHNNYLVVHTIMTCDKGDTYSVYWAGDTILTKKKITYKKVRFPYRVVKLNNSDKTEFYGIFREVIESQKAINQALIQIQLMVNSSKAFVANGAVKSISDFTTAFNRVNSVIPVQNLQGIKIENLSGDIQKNYFIMDKALERIKLMLGVNDSFLGQAFASDSGRKVKLQSNASIITLNYITEKIELYYKLVGWDIVHLIQQYYTSHRVLRIADEAAGDRWVELNKPIEAPGPNGPTPIWDEEIDPESGEAETDEYGNILLTPLNDSRTDIRFLDVDLKIEASSYSDEDEKNQLLLETMLSGAIGNALLTVNPGGFMKAASLAVKSMKSKHSPDIAEILDTTAQMLAPQPEQQAQLGSSGPQQGAQQNGQPMSAQLKLPQNTQKEG